MNWSSGKKSRENNVCQSILIVEHCIFMIFLLKQNQRLNVNFSIFLVNLVERDPCPGGFQLVNPEESGKRNQFDLVELAGAIQNADKFTRATAGSKLSVIAEQVRFLQEQARKVLEEAQRDQEINHMACNFKRIPGKVYYIYKRANGKKYMSMISPDVSFRILGFIINYFKIKIFIGMGKGLP